MHHHQGGGSHKNRGSGHSNDTGGTGGDPVDLHSYSALVVHEHTVNLRSGHAVTARRVDPDGNIALTGQKLRLESGRGNIIVKPALLGNGAVKVKGAALV
mgnify:CR=1 FL=1